MRHRLAKMLANIQRDSPDIIDGSRIYNLTTFKNLITLGKATIQFKVCYTVNVLGWNDRHGLLHCTPTTRMRMYSHLKVGSQVNCLICMLSFTRSLSSVSTTLATTARTPCSWASTTVCFQSTRALATLSNDRLKASQSMTRVSLSKFLPSSHVSLRNKSCSKGLSLIYEPKAASGHHANKVHLDRRRLAPVLIPGGQRQDRYVK